VSLHYPGSTVFRNEVVSPNSEAGEPGLPSVWPLPIDSLIWLTLPGAYAPASTAFRVIWTCKPPHHVKAIVQGQPRTLTDLCQHAGGVGLQQRLPLIHGPETYVLSEVQGAAFSHNSTPASSLHCRDVSYPRILQLVSRQDVSHMSRSTIRGTERNAYM
jgi:hypothetical protein